MQKINLDCTERDKQEIYERIKNIFKMYPELLGHIRTKSTSTKNLQANINRIFTVSLDVMDIAKCKTNADLEKLICDAYCKTNVQTRRAIRASSFPLNHR